MAQKLLIIMNPHSGQKRANRLLTDIVVRCHEAGFHPTVLTTRYSGDGVTLVKEYGKAYDRILCIGGDGTFNEAVAGTIAAELRVPIGYIPCGSTNDFAYSLGLSNKVMQATQDALGSCSRPIDAGSFNGRLFTYTASFGAFTRASYSTSQEMKNMLGHTAYILEGMKDLTTLKPRRLKVEIDGEAIEGDFLFGAVSNSVSLGGLIRLDKKLVEFNDGQLELLLIRTPANPIEAGLILHALNTSDFNNDLIVFRSAQRFRFVSEEPFAWTLDGEAAGSVTEANIEVLPHAFRLLLPATITPR